MTPALSEELEEQIAQACRTAMGDDLRSVTYLGPNDVRHIYTRGDLVPAEDSLTFLESERAGLESQRKYGWSELGGFRYAIRAFENGFLGRVVRDDHSIYITSDSVTVGEFDEISETIRTILEDD